MYVKSNHLQAWIEPRPSIDCCCRLQECNPCRILASHGIAALQSTRALDLCKTPPTFLKHVLVPVNLLEPHTMLCSMGYAAHLPIHLSIAGICIVTYLKYASSTNSNVRLGFSYPGQIRDCYPGHLGQQLWPGFNAGVCIYAFMHVYIYVYLFVFPSATIMW